MKVLVISHTYISPINREKWKVLAQRHSDITLTVVFPTQWPSCLFLHDVAAENLTAQNSINCSFHALPARGTGNEVRYVYQIKQLLQLLKVCRADLIHVEQGATALSFAQAILLTKFLRLKTKFTFFTWINWYIKPTLGHLIFWRLVEKLNISHSAGAFAGNQEAAKILHEKGLSRPIEVLPQLGVDLNVFYPAETEEEKQIFHIGFVGRLVEEKGIFLLLQAFAYHAANNPTWRLIFAGKGPAYERLMQEIKKLGLDNRVSIIDSIPHHKIADLMRTLDILVLPSFDTPTWKEQFGHVLIEAMACKVAIIGSNAGEIPNVIQSAGLVFQQKNFIDLTQKLEQLMSNTQLRESLALAGFQRAQQCYTHEAIADATYSFWKKIINS